MTDKEIERLNAKWYREFLHEQYYNNTISVISCDCCTEYRLDEKHLIETCPICKIKMCPSCKNSHGKNCQKKIFSLDNGNLKKPGYVYFEADCHEDFQDSRFFGGYYE